MVASKPFITSDDDLHWKGMLATYVYNACGMDGVGDREKEQFWRRCKPLVGRMMRVRKQYVMTRFRTKIVSEYSGTGIADGLHCLRVVVCTF